MKSVKTIIAEALAAGQNTLSEYDSKRILTEYGIPATRELLTEDFADVEQAADRIGYPVALKTCAAAAQHKTEMGLIELGVTDAVELKRAYDRMAPKAHDLGGAILQVFVDHERRNVCLGLNGNPATVEEPRPITMATLRSVLGELEAACSQYLVEISRWEVRAGIQDLRLDVPIEEMHFNRPVQACVLVYRDCPVNLYPSAGST